MKASRLAFVLAAMTAVGHGTAWGQAETSFLAQPLQPQIPATYGISDMETGGDVRPSQPQIPATYASSAETGGDEQSNDLPAAAPGEDAAAKVHSARQRDAADSEESSDYDNESDESGCWECGGWLQQGVTLNGYNPSDRSNGTVVMNDRANDYMMNQFWLFANRDIDTDNCGWDYGGRFDIVYGTDAVYLKDQDGLEESWDETGMYQVALPQFYLDLAYNNWTLRTGQFNSPVGYEDYMAPNSFFYSHSYTFFASPKSLVGVLLKNQVTDELSVDAGLHRGTDQFNDTDGKNAADFVGGFTWESCDERTWFDFHLIAQEKGIDNHSIEYSIMGGVPLTRDWDYVYEWLYGDLQGQHAEWYGFNQHLTRTINDCWSYGYRFEVFRDDDGEQIFGFRDRNTAEGPFVGNFYEVTMCASYKPCPKLQLRPEIRWDYYAPDNGGPHPFNDETRNNQFVASFDAIWTF